MNEWPKITELEIRKRRAEKWKTKGEPTSSGSVRAALAFTSPESNVGLTPLPCPWWKYGVGDTLPRADAPIAGGTLRREGAAADNRGTSAMDGTATDDGGGWMCNSGAASEAARDRDLRCSRRRRLSSRSFPSDIFCSLDPEIGRRSTFPPC